MQSTRLIGPKTLIKARIRLKFHPLKGLLFVRVWYFLLFLLYISMSTSPIIGLVIGYTKINLINSIIIALGMILALILVLSRVYRKYFYRDDDD